MGVMSASVSVYLKFAEVAFALTIGGFTWGWIRWPITWSKSSMELDFEVWGESFKLRFFNGLMILLIYPKLSKFGEGITRGIFSRLLSLIALFGNPPYLRLSDLRSEL